MNESQLVENQNLADPIQLAVKRMRSKLSINLLDYLKACFGENFSHVSYESYSMPYVWLTDEPDTVFPMDRCYHVTDFRAVLNLARGTPLLPPAAFVGSNINPGRGWMISIMSDFLGNFGIKTKGTGDFVFMGSQPDPEIFAIYDHLKSLGVRTTQDLNAELFKLFFSERTRNNRDTELFVLSDDFGKIIDALDGKKTPEGEKIETVVGRFLEKLYLLSFLRDGWFNELRELTGEAIQSFS